MYLSTLPELRHSITATESEKQQDHWYKESPQRRQDSRVHYHLVADRFRGLPDKFRGSLQAPPPLAVLPQTYMYTGKIKEPKNNQNPPKNKEKKMLKYCVAALHRYSTSFPPWISNSTKRTEGVLEISVCSTEVYSWCPILCSKGIKHGLFWNNCGY